MLQALWTDIPLPADPSCAPGLRGGHQSTCGAFSVPYAPPPCLPAQQNQVGSLTMELLDLELRRAAHWQQREGVGVAGVGAALLAARPLAAREQRLALALARQEPLLYAGLSLLLNMAEDAGVEQKMVKKVGGHLESCSYGDGLRSGGSGGPQRRLWGLQAAEVAG